MGGKPRIPSQHALRGAVIFKPKDSLGGFGASYSTRASGGVEQNMGTGGSVHQSDGVAFLFGIDHRGTLLHRVGDLSKRTITRHPKRFGAFVVAADEWTAGGHGGIYHSSNEGGDWLYEPIKVIGGETIRTIARWDGAWWVGTAEGTLAYREQDETSWHLVARPGAGRFAGVASGTSLTYDQVAITRLITLGNDLYVLGLGLWRIVKRKAKLERKSDVVLICAALTSKGTLLVGGDEGTLLRRPNGGRFVDVKSDPAPKDMTCIGIIELAAGILFVGSRHPSPFYVSTDDGMVLSALPKLKALEPYLPRHRLLSACADGQGGALIAGFAGLVVRVAADPQAWTPVATTKPTPRKKAATPKAATLPRSAKADAALMAEIRRAPDEDAPRLVYADYLLDHQDPRGEFIQIQCMLGRAIWGAEGFVRDSDPPLSNLIALETREAELYKKHRKAWMAPFAKVVRKWRWRRGFIEGFTSGKTFFDHATAIFEAHPVLEVRLQGLGPKDFSRLTTTPLPGVKSLNISRQRLTPEILFELASSPAFAEIEELDLFANAFGLEGARVLAEQFPQRLKSLRLSWCEIGVEGVLAILDVDAPNLEAIDLYHLDLDDDGWRTVKAHSRGSLVST